MKVVGLISMLILLAVLIGAVRTSAPRDVQMRVGGGFGQPPERQIREPDSQPMWSPDGRTILFRRQGAVLAVGREGGRPRPVVKQGSVTWLPNGKLGVSSYPGVYTMNPDRSGKRLITTSGLLTWSPDGEKVVVGSRYSPEPDTTKLLVVDVRTGAERRIPRPRCRCSWTGGQPVWSPDSKRLLFATRFIDASGGWWFELDIVNADGTNVRRVAKAKANAEIEEVAWSPQGDRVAATAWDESGRVLWVISVESGSKTPIGRGATPKWSPSGDLLAYRRVDGVYVSRPDGSGVTRLWGPSGPNRSPQWSRDGQSILWGSGPSIVVSSVDGAKGRIVAEGVDAVWSPENDRIAFATPRCGADQGVYVVRPDGSDVMRLSRHCTIYGTSLPERIAGTPAADTIVARDRCFGDGSRCIRSGKDQVDCGDGVDRAIVDRIDAVRNCERVRRG
jgi:Tol biopolymer transport system component